MHQGNGTSNADGNTATLLSAPNIPRRMRHETYSNPKLKRPHTSIFRLLVICRFHTIFIGSSNTQRSTIAFTKPAIMGALAPSLVNLGPWRHLAGSSQRVSTGCGLHCVRDIASSATQYARTTIMMDHHAILKRRSMVKKIRRYINRIDIRTTVISSA